VPVCTASNQIRFKLRKISLTFLALQLSSDFVFAFAVAVDFCCHLPKARRGG
jgi:hypothetical protein